jgi:fatty-acid peroxygenase
MAGGIGGRVAAIPRERTPDSSLALLREGFEFVTNRCRRLGTDTFSTRLLLRPVVCMQGAEAARFFTETPMTRRGAVPRPLLALVQDVGSVATLDGEMHLCRKRMFLDMMSDDELGRLERISDAEWRLAAERWRRADRVILLPAVEELLCRVACDWAGVPRVEPETWRRAAELSAMVDGAGSIGPRNLRGHVRRRSSERWAATTIRRTRSGEGPEGESPAAVISRHRDADGRPLDEAVAAVELLNLLRPMVATARFVAFAALALHRYPEVREAVREGDAEHATAFVQEVRRFYPFFPAIGGRTLADAEWRGEKLPPGQWVLLDLHGTNRDPRTWESPERFLPERFRGRPHDPYTFVPQGAGDVAAGHRCPGEWATIAFVRSAVRALTRDLRYTVPEQDVRIPRSHIPPRPASGFVIRPTDAEAP